MTSVTTLFKNQTGGTTIAAGEKVFSAGGIFGEMAMIDGSTRSADAVAAEESVVLPIGQQQFDFLITETPHFARLVMKILVERLRAANSSCT